MSHILYDLLLPSMIKCQISSLGLILISGPFSLSSKSSLILVLMQEFLDFYLYIDLTIRLSCLATICINRPVALLFLRFTSLSSLIPSIFCFKVNTIFLMALKRSSMSRTNTVKMRMPWPEVRTTSRNVMILKMPVGGRESDTRSQNGKVISRMIICIDKFK